MSDNTSDAKGESMANDLDESINAGAGLGDSLADGQRGFLGDFLDAQLAPGRPRTWRNAFLALLAAIAVLGAVATNHHPHFVYDARPFFWPAFGLAAGLALIFAAKKIIQPLIKRPEDHYDDL
jgi:hypothetical protein